MQRALLITAAVLVAGSVSAQGPKPAETPAEKPAPIVIKIEGTQQDQSAAAERRAYRTPQAYDFAKKQEVARAKYEALLAAAKQKLATAKTKEAREAAKYEIALYETELRELPMTLEQQQAQGKAWADSWKGPEVKQNPRDIPLTKTKLEVDGAGYLRARTVLNPKAMQSGNVDAVHIVDYGNGFVTVNGKRMTKQKWLQQTLSTKRSTARPRTPTRKTPRSH